MTRDRFIKHIPNTLTLTNLSLGLGAILFLIQSENPQRILIAAVLIMLGALGDFFDGFLARKLNAVTAIGKQLDSFADIITFGVAPILLINYVSQCRQIAFILGSSLIFITAGAYRLARFNLHDFSKHFVGLPITGAGIALTIYCIAYPLWLTYLCYDFSTLITTGFIILLSVLMISSKKVRRILS